VVAAVFNSASHDSVKVRFSMNVLFYGNCVDQPLLPDTSHAQWQQNLDSAPQQDPAK